MKQKDIQFILSAIANKLELASSREEAIKLNKSSYLFLEFASVYGGYRVVSVAVEGGRHFGALGESSIVERIPAKQMYLKLSGILQGIELRDQYKS